jgi:hypothetical protein
MVKRTIILSVDEDKAQGLIDALSTRDHIEVLEMDRKSRKRFRDCPCCKKRLSKEITYTINETMIMRMLAVLQKMAISKTVILTNKDIVYSSLPDIEKERCTEFDLSLLRKAKTLGLLKPFVDGSRETYFTDALEFFSNEEEHSPSYMITLDGEVVETGGGMFFDGVKLKDEKSRDRIKREFRDALKNIPKETITFVKNGQLSLV